MLIRVVGLTLLSSDGQGNLGHLQCHRQNVTVYTWNTLRKKIMPEEELQIQKI